jgi:hypothetical protein
MSFASAILLLALGQDAPPAPGAVALAGRVVDAGGQPRAGVEVWASGPKLAFGTPVPVAAKGRTDDAGRFRLEVPKAEITGIVGDRALWALAPDGAIAGRVVPLDAAPKADDLVLTLGPPAGADLRVVGPGGEPVPQARVTPMMVKLPGSRFPASAFILPDPLRERLTATADAAGRARLAGFPPEAIHIVHVEAPAFGVQGWNPTPAEGGLTVALTATGAVEGRVVADDPAAAAGLAVSLVTYDPAAPDRGGGFADVKTDGDGRFRVPAIAAGPLIGHVFPPGGGPAIRLPNGRIVAPGGTTQAGIDLRSPAAAGAIAQGAPPRVRTLAGLVRDRRGRPVAGATVSQSGDAPTRTETTTDAAGRFALDGVAQSNTYVFINKEGHRFAAAPIARDATGADITLARTDEPPDRALKSLPPPVPREEALALARRLLDPAVEAIRPTGDPSLPLRTLEALARVDPAAALEKLDGGVLREPFLVNIVRHRVAEALLDDSPDEALAVIETMDDPAFRTRDLMRVAGRLAATDRPAALAALDRALLAARTAQEPTGIRVLLLGQVAEQWLDLGERDRAAALLREAQPDAAALPDEAWAAYAKGAFAEELAQIDPPAALGLVKDLKDPFEFDRHHGNIAHELAAIQPAEAERVLGMLRDKDPLRGDRLRGDYTVRVAYRMAAVDRDRARRLADAIADRPLRAYALGLMAGIVAKTDRAAAEGLLRDAFDVLENRPGGRPTPAPPGYRTMYSRPGVAAVLLPVAEAIDPGLVPEYLARALALRPPYQGGELFALTDAPLAFLVARYDRDIARGLLDRLVRPDGTPVAEHQAAATAVALAAVDPARAAALVEAMPATPAPPGRPSPADLARLDLARFLARRGDDRWTALHERGVLLWIPDHEDLGDE